MRRPAMSNASSVLRLVPPLEEEDEAVVVAEILSDGTVRSLRPDLHSRVEETGQGWSSGQVSNGGWFLWWQRRMA